MGIPLIIKRRFHIPECKSRVAIDAISDGQTIQQLSADHSIDQIHFSQWKNKLLDGASELFMRGKKSKEKEEG